MDKPRPILRVGLTGGIASGKTTVAGFLAELGAFVLDADRIAHELMEPGGATFKAVAERFGAHILDATGRIRRSALGQLVFTDSEARKALNSIVHPKVMAEVEVRIQRYLRKGHATVAVVDAALLVEAGVLQSFHRLVVVRCRPESQLRRLVARSGLSEEEALARIRSQGNLEEKLAVADHVIDTDGTLRETRRQTERVYVSLQQDFESLA